MAYEAINTDFFNPEPWTRFRYKYGSSAPLPYLVVYVNLPLGEARLYFENRFGVLCARDYESRSFENMQDACQHSLVSRSMTVQEFCNLPDVLVIE